ncbi:GNAT family N-acetyltransferase/peptidase C39 family protein [Marivibrio halodurans]|uniref:GNAT family N-acetyltransferase/peptidase C39 family protein n=1 Tax=Marivibrio halodurans TaxID=2039722 RepID=A0A8J7S1M8_9PROT|nr:GNAT family N-acetyltransferase/peptidase C39 family protein [Marivibrio halodurans]MBP5858620.1 GNAT family N-acetyltransferase/peptidase C39 family protein [Marivibrio halodurans]
MRATPRKTTGATPAIRPATLADIDALLAVEEAAFPGDRLSRRSFRHLLKRGHQATFVACDADDRPVGYAMVLFHRGTSLARLYSFALLPDWRGWGVAEALLDAAEADCRAEGIIHLRLEVRADNARALRFYERAGYEPFGAYAAYYDDATDAVRMQKHLAPRPVIDPARFPYLAQSLNFTCGPACLMMAMRALDETAPVDRMEELRIWRESTTIFMTRGIGGTSPYGLALAARRRGFPVTLHVVDPDIMFIDSVRTPAKKEVVRLVQEDYLAQCAEAGIPIATERLSLDGLEAALKAGAAPIVLISTYALDRERTPHWVVPVEIDERFVHVHDPFVDEEEHQTQIDRMLVPIPRADFERMSRYGRAKQRAALLIHPKTS